MTGTLYLIATPIGNMEDITLRAIKILNEVDILLCEDTRHTGLLVKYGKELISNFKFQISKQDQKSKFEKLKLLSYYEHNEIERIPEVITLLKQGKDIGLVSDAGTPLISDPGYKLVRECLKYKIKVVPVPGPSSILAALTASGLPTNRFTFLGYLPKKEGKRIKEIERLKNKETMGTIIFFETKERLQETLNIILETLGDIEIVICRELTKLHEEIWRGKVNEALIHFQNPKGEFVIIY